MAKLMMGNINDKEAVLTINQRPYKVAAGVGAKKPDGPSLDLKPGKYKCSLRLPGQPAQEEVLEVGADEAWGLLIGPGGLLPLQMY